MGVQARHIATTARRIVKSCRGKPDLRRYPKEWRPYLRAEMVRYATAKTMPNPGSGEVTRELVLQAS